MEKRQGLETIAIHGRSRKWPVSSVTSSLTVPIFETASFEIRSLEDARQIVGRGGATFLHGEDYIYSRGGNPTTRALETRLAELEGARDSVVFGSGMAAVAAISSALLKPGDHAIVSSHCFGDTYHIFNRSLRDLGVRISFVDTSDLRNVEKTIRRSTKIVYIETPANPTLQITDLAGVATICKRADIVSVIDSTFASPCVQTPLSYGCDVVIQSLTKYIGGHGDALGGAVVTSDSDILTKSREQLFATGAILDPFAAFLILRGVETLPLRVRQHCANAMKVARALSRNPAVIRVHYPGLPDHPQHALARQQMRGFGGIVAFEVAGGIPAAERFLSRLRLCTFAVSLGSTKTLIEFPAGMTHKIVEPKARKRLGIYDSLIRMSVGLENYRDILADVEQALAQ